MPVICQGQADIFGDPLCRPVVLAPDIAEAKLIAVRSLTKYSAGDAFRAVAYGGRTALGKAPLGLRSHLECPSRTRGQQAIFDKRNQRTVAGCRLDAPK